MNFDTEYTVRKRVSVAPDAKNLFKVYALTFAMDEDVEIILLGVRLKVLEGDHLSFGHG